MRQLDTSLRRMRTDHVDLWLAHTWDEHTPIEETVERLVWAVPVGPGALRRGLEPRRAGRLRARMSLLAASRVPLVADSVEYSLSRCTPEDELAGPPRRSGSDCCPGHPWGGGF